MTDAEALELLKTFTDQHSRCGNQPISTEFAEDRDNGGIHVIKRCRVCSGTVATRVTKGAAKSLLRL